MTIELKLDLPEGLIEEARKAGIFERGNFRLMVEREIARRRACGEFGQMLRQLHSVKDEPMPLEEIQAEVIEVREERRRPREGGY